MTLVRVNEYAYGVWFKLLSETPTDFTFYDHLLDCEVTLTKDNEVYKNFDSTSNDITVQVYYNSLE